MSRNRETLPGACLFAVFAVVLFAAQESYATDSCAEQLENAKLERGDEGESRPHMEIANKHIAAAEAAMQSGDEAKCVQEVQEAMTWIRMNRPDHDQ